MAKNTVTTPIKDGVQADNSTYSSNQIVKVLTAMDDKLDESIAALTQKIDSLRTIFEINVDYNAGDPTMDKTYPEIQEAYEKNALFIININMGSSYNPISSLADYVQESSGFITISTEIVRKNAVTNKLYNIITAINASEYYTAPTVTLSEIE